ncbi:MAG TPA: LapA family protein [bacterium]|nr:LapA family protein [bacterium]
MAAWRFVKVILAALILFVVANFFITNSTEQAASLATKISFKFNMPPFLYLESIDFPVGYLLIIAFTLGMVFAALIGAVNAFTRNREVKMKNKTIRELEREIDELRDSLAREKNVLPEVKLSEELNRLPSQPEIH